MQQEAAESVQSFPHSQRMKPSYSEIAPTPSQRSLIPYNQPQPYLEDLRKPVCSNDLRKPVCSNVRAWVEEGSKPMSEIRAVFPRERVVESLSRRALKSTTAAAAAAGGGAGGGAGVDMDREGGRGKDEDGGLTEKEGNDERERERKRKRKETVRQLY